MDEKKPWQSKTIWFGVITAISAFFPPVQVFMATNPEMASAVVGGAFTALRLISKDKIQIK